MKSALCFTSVLRRYCVGVFGIALLLAACAQTPEPTVLGGLLRNPTAPLGGSSRFEARKFQGQWQTVSCIGTCAANARYSTATDGVYLREAGGAQTPYTISAPGVLREVGADNTLVVMWVDEGFRTAAVGDANGRWAAVIDRTATSSPDRIKAATEILDFYGWDTAKLKRVK